MPDERFEPVGVEQRALIDLWLQLTLDVATVPLSTPKPAQRRSSSVRQRHRPRPVGGGGCAAGGSLTLMGLARSLSNLGLCLSGVGRREEALAPAQEAATI